MDIIPAVAGNKTLVINAEFVKLTIYNDVSNTANVNVYTFSSSYKSEVIDGTTYTPLGGLLAIGVQQRDLRVTSSDTSISLSGIDGNNIQIVLASEGKIRGSQVEIIRGFYDANYNLSNTAHRFTGIVTSYNIAEEWDEENNKDNFTVNLNASSFKTVLENRIAGRKTNQSSWQYFTSTDSSMNNVYAISGRHFDFGMPVTAKTTNPSQAGTEGQSSNQSDLFNGGYGP